MTSNDTPSNGTEKIERHAEVMGTENAESIWDDWDVRSPAVTKVHSRLADCGHERRGYSRQNNNCSERESPKRKPAGRNRWERLQNYSTPSQRPREEQNHNVSGRKICVNVFLCPEMEENYSLFEEILKKVQEREGRKSE